MKTVDRYTYTKDSGETSDRELLVVAPAPKPNVRAFDLTGLSAEEQDFVCTSYQAWRAEHYLPYIEKEKSFKESYLLEFQDYFAALSAKKAPTIKSFKQGGLKLAI